MYHLQQPEINKIKILEFQPAHLAQGSIFLIKKSKVANFFLFDIFPVDMVLYGAEWLQSFWYLDFQSQSSMSNFVPSSWKLNNQYYIINPSVQLLGTDFSCEYLYILYNLGDNGTNSSASFLGLKNGEMPWFF